jgi:hypothetical protein
MTIMSSLESVWKSSRGSLSTNSHKIVALAAYINGLIPNGILLK